MAKKVSNVHSGVLKCDVSYMERVGLAHHVQHRIPAGHEVMVRDVEEDGHLYVEVVDMKPGFTTVVKMPYFDTDWEDLI